MYLTLLDLGVATASQIPALSRVPRTRIYTTVQQLHGKGLVQILPEKPLRYRPIPFSAYLKTLQEDYRNRADRIATNLDALGQEFHVQSTREVERGGRFEALYGRRNVRKKISEMYAKAETEIIAVGSSRSPTRILRSFAPELADRQRAGVGIKYAFHLTSDNADAIRALSRYAEVRTVDWYVPVCRHGVDGREFLMSHPIPDDDSTNRGEDIAIWTNDVAIAEAMTEMAELLWKKGSAAVQGSEAKDERRALVTSAGSSGARVASSDP